MRFSVQYGQICTCMDHILNVNNCDSYSNIHTLGRYEYRLTEIPWEAINTNSPTRRFKQSTLK